MNTLFRYWICLVCVGITLYALVKQQNELTKIQMAIPQVKKELTKVQQENMVLQYELQMWEEPSHLQELLRKPEFGHLSFDERVDED